MKKNRKVRITKDIFGTNAVVANSITVSRILFSFALLFLLPLLVCVAGGRKYGVIFVCIAATVTVMIEIFNAVQGMNLCDRKPESDDIQEVRRI